MKISSVGILLSAFFLSSCISVYKHSLTNLPGSTRIPADIRVPTTSIPTASPFAARIATPTEPSSTSERASLPTGLVVVYSANDALWLWTRQGTKLLAQRQNVFTPLLSDDGEWFIFWQEYASSNGYSGLSGEIWLMRTDGSELRRLLGAEELTTLVERNEALLVNEIDWLPGRHELLFNTKRVMDGPPGVWPVFDLYLIDLSGRIVRLAGAEQGGRFNPAPDGSYVAVAYSSRIRILDTETGVQAASFEFEPFWLGCECVYTPEIVWDTQGRFIMTSIPPQKLLYPDYGGEPEEIWRIYVNGDVELVARIQPFSQKTVRFSPDLHYFLYLGDGCVDGMGRLSVHNLFVPTEDVSLFCVWELPQWTPDSEHFIYKLDGVWQVGSVFDPEGHPLDFLNISTVSDVHATPQIKWINDTHFLLTLQSREACTLNIATLQGIVIEIARTAPDACPQADFSFSE